MGERSATSEPHILCYVSRRGTRRAQRGRSEAEKSFFYPYCAFAERFFTVIRQFIFFVFLFSRGVRGELEKEKLLIIYLRN